MIEVLTIFLGAFLVFLVQPLIGNVLLPVFGGTANVWSACLAAFQILLVGGYFYAHVVGRPGKGANGRLGVHAALLFVAAGWLFFVAFRHRDILAFLTSAEALPPACGALLCIAALVAGPYILLSSNSSLVQVLSGGRYKLYAVSNLGSMLGLLAYPFAFELFLPLSGQWLVFAGAATVYAVLFSFLLVRGRRGSTCSSAPSTESPGLKSTDCRLSSSYFLLSFVSCYLLNAISTHLCTDITPLPMLWAVLLAGYLLSYILAFTDRGSRLAPWMAVFVVPLSFFGVWHFVKRGPEVFSAELATGIALLVLGGWIVHARLYRLRPAAAGLTRYYLMIALGGAAGGAVCSFVMPSVTTIVAEYPIALAAILGVIACDGRDALAALARRPACQAVAARSADPQVRALFAFLAVLNAADGESSSRRGVKCARYSALAFLAAFASYGIVHGHAADGRVLRRYRNFYGLGHVNEKSIRISAENTYRAIEFTSCGTVHGMQIGEGTWRSAEPTTYYADHAGGLAIVKHPKRLAKEPMRVALCGLGIGTLAAYSQTGDLYRFFEINPAVARIARAKGLFTFLSGAAGTVDVVMADARRALSREAASESDYDVIVVDVFTGDSIPPHMATKEAFRLYLDRLAADGTLAVHLSNWHLDLLPMVKAAAKEFGLNLEAYVCRPTHYAFSSCWAFLSREPLSRLYDEKKHSKIDFTKVKDIPLMEDGFHSLLPYLRKDVFRAKTRP